MCCDILQVVIKHTLGMLKCEAIFSDCAQQSFMPNDNLFFVLLNYYSLHKPFLVNENWWRSTTAGVLNGTLPFMICM